MEELFTTLLDLAPLEVTLAEVGAKKITLHCCSTLSESHCPLCLKKCNFVKDKYTRELRDLPISGKEVTLRFTVRQFVCKDCNRHFHEQYDFAPKSSTMTQRYEDYIYFRCQGVDLRYVSLQEDVGWSKVRDIFEKYAHKEIASRDAFTPLTHLGIDEIALKKGHKNFVAILVNLETGQVVDVLEERSKSYLKSYFLSKGSDFCEQVRCFCSDLWEGYLNCAAEVFPNATIIADRFHFFAYLNKEVDRCRRSLRKKYPKADDIKHLKYTLLKPKENLPSETLEALEKVLKRPEYALLKHTWEARNAFRDILEMHCSRAKAETLIEEWQRTYTQKGNHYIGRFVKFLNSWKSYILNYFTYRHTTSPIEGINNKLKLIKRRAYGFLTFEAFRLRAIVEF